MYSIDYRKGKYSEAGIVLLLCVLEVSPLEAIVQLRLIGEPVKAGSVIFNNGP